jgi:hypothetical protein
MTEPNQVVAASGRKFRLGIWIAGVLVISCATWLVWARFYVGPDPVAESAPVAKDVVDFRKLLNRIQPPAGVPLKYSQAVAPNGDAGFEIAMNAMNPGRGADPKSFTANDLTLPLARVVAIAKASEWKWTILRYEALINRPHDSVIVLEAHYSPSTLRHINLSKVTSEQLFKAADYSKLDPMYRFVP